MNAIRNPKTETTAPASQGTVASQPQPDETVTIPLVLFFFAMDQVRRANSGIDIAAGMIRDLIPTEDEDGDIDTVGRQVEYLTAKIADESETIFQKYIALMQAAGLKADNSGLYLRKIEGGAS